jgi:hypothetical protein
MKDRVHRGRPNERLFEVQTRLQCTFFFRFVFYKLDDIFITKNVQSWTNRLC